MSAERAVLHSDEIKKSLLPVQSQCARHSAALAPQRMMSKTLRVRRRN